jgi:hypothetical protein
MDLWMDFGRSDWHKKKWKKIYWVGEVCFARGHDKERS